MASEANLSLVIVDGANLLPEMVLSAILAFKTVNGDKDLFVILVNDI
jgi:hypothetical protein